MTPCRLRLSCSFIVIAVRRSVLTAKAKVSPKVPEWGFLNFFFMCIFSKNPQHTASDSMMIWLSLLAARLCQYHWMSEEGICLPLCSYLECVQLSRVEFCKLFICCIVSVFIWEWLPQSIPPPLRSIWSDRRGAGWKRLLPFSTAFYDRIQNTCHFWYPASIPPPRPSLFTLPICPGWTSL